LTRVPLAAPQKNPLTASFETPHWNSSKSGLYSNKKMLRQLFSASSSDGSDNSKASDDEEENLNTTFKEPPETTRLDIISHHAQTRDFSIHLKQEKQRGIAHQLWPAARILCHYFENNEICASNDYDSVLELGAGIGLCGMFVGKLTALKVYLTDIEDAQTILKDNIALNHLDERVSFATLRWGKDFVHTDIDPILHQIYLSRQSAGYAVSEKKLLIIASDCVYWEHLFEPFFETISYVLHKLPSKMIIAHVKRWKKDSKFFKLCQKSLLVEKISESVDSLDDEFDGSKRRQIQRIYQISLKENL
jgi:predicted nicotinamide N-methyase